MASYLEKKWMLNVNAEGLPLVGITSAMVAGRGPRYFKETDEVRNLGSDVNVRA
jgi:hypothetical protein